MDISQPSEPPELGFDYGPERWRSRATASAATVTYRVDADPFLQGVCHCTDCQRQTGTAYSVVVGVPRAAFTMEGDSLSSFATTGEDHGTPSERYFCSNCGSPIVT